MPACALLLLAACTAWLAVVPVYSKPFRGPVFVQEPPSRLDFTNSSGASAGCSGRGLPAPTVRWETGDGGAIGPIQGLREVKSDGTLVFLPFRGTQYRQDIHNAIYRCLITNTAGTVRSRDMMVRAVLLQSYDVRVYDQFVPRGNTALMRCHVPAVVRDHVSVVLWVRDDGVNIGPPGISSDKYAVLPSGELLVRNTSPTDAFRGYKCQTRHQLTNELITSSTAGQLIVTEPHTPLSPKVIESKPSLRASVGDTVYLPCVGQGVPKPQSTWYKKQGSLLRPTTENHRSIQAHELVIFRKVTVQDSGTYVCMVNNSVGREEMTIELVVTAPLSAHIQPASQLADVGRRAALTCRITGHPVGSVTWIKDGRALTLGGRVSAVSRDVIQLTPVQREDRGMYQCLVSNEVETAQASAEITIGEDAPVFTYAFPEQSSRPGSAVSLKCSASGKPLPQITWSLDGMPLPEAYHIRIGDYVSTEYAVNSYVNISNVVVEDGGLYTCAAQNEVGRLEHSAKLNVFGPPYVRPMANVSALAGKNIVIHCPVAGYPIDKIAWEKEGRRLPQSHRQHVFANGTLLLEQVLRSSDSGSYTCLASDSQGRSAKREVHVSVLIPPVVEPFAFPKDLTEGKRAGVACVVSAGDLPIRIRWLKDDKNLPEELKASISSANDFTSFLSFPAVHQSHNGQYTCVASNPVASSNSSAVMTVFVPPQWRVEPNDKSAVLGEVVTFDCQSGGFPAPVIRWKRATGSTLGNFEVIISSANIQIRENGSLTIREVSKEDSGSYMCQATNGVGPGLSTVVHLTVHVAAHFSRRFEAQSVKKGEPLTLLCDVKGEKPITVSWTKDRHSFNPRMESRTSIESDWLFWAYRYVLEEEEQPEGFKSTIRIPSADRRDSALFTCIAENTYGKDEITFQVIVQEPPDRPRNPAVMAKGSRSFSVSWSHPYSGNSPLSSYILEYCQSNESWENAKKVTVEGSVNEFTVQNLIPLTTYGVRLFAENTLGVSEPSEHLVVTTEEEAPSGPPQDIQVTATSSRSMRVTWKTPSQKDWHGQVQGYYVGVKAVGQDEPFSYKTVEPKGTAGVQGCDVTNLQANTKYVVVVQAFNSKGAGPISQEIIEETMEFDPPLSPRLSVMSVSSTSIHVSWEDVKGDSNPIGGYVLSYKSDNNKDWEEITVAKERTSYLVQGLQCGRRYQVTMSAFNAAGRGQPSDVVVARTEGSAPVVPERSRLIMVNSSTAALHLLSWESGGCPINLFVVQYKLRDQREWVLLSNNILPAQRIVVIPDLTPGSWYTLLMTATNDAGSTEAEFQFATLTESGATVPPLAMSPDPGREFMQQLKIIIPLVCTTVVLVLFATVGCVVLVKRRNAYSSANTYQQAEEPREPPEVSKTMDTVPMTVWEKRPRAAETRTLGQSREQLYFPSPYATSRVSMYSEYEADNRVPSAPHGWKPHDRVEHTYDVPFLRRHLPAETSEASIADRLLQKNFLISENLCLPAVVELPPEHGDEAYVHPVLDRTVQGIRSSSGGDQHHPFTKLRNRRARHRSEPKLRTRHHIRHECQRYSDGESEENAYSFSDVEESGLCEDFEMSETECDRHLQIAAWRRRDRISEN